jgi:hypothetical protein
MPTPTDTSNLDTGFSSAAGAFEAFLSGETPGKQTPDKPKQNAPAEEAEALEAEDHSDETPDPNAVAQEGEAEGDGAEEAEADADEEANSQAGKADPNALTTVKIDGKEQVVTVAEAAAGYQRQQDYSRKTAALAAERQQFHGEFEAVRQERQQYQQLLGALETQLEGQLQEQPDWDALYQSNPLEYVRQKDLWREREEQLEAARFERQRVNELEEAERAKMIASAVRESRTKMVEAIPAWKDKAKWDADRAKIREYGRQLGFTDEELSKTYDHRAVVAIYKAMRYDELVSKRPTPQRPTGPIPSKPGAPASMPTAKATQVKRERQRLAQTGNVRDAAKLFESIL